MSWNHPFVNPAPIVVNFLGCNCTTLGRTISNLSCFNVSLSSELCKRQSSPPVPAQVRQQRGWEVCSERHQDGEGCSYWWGTKHIVVKLRRSIIESWCRIMPSVRTPRITPCLGVHSEQWQPGIATSHNDEGLLLISHIRLFNHVVPFS